MYESQRWNPGGVVGLQCRSNGTYIYRRRIKGCLYRIYLGRVHQIDAEDLAAILADSPPESWPRLVECTKKVFEWEYSTTC